MYRYIFNNNLLSFSRSLSLSPSSSLSFFSETLYTYSKLFVGAVKINFVPHNKSSNPLSECVCFLIVEHISHTLVSFAAKRTRIHAHARTHTHTHILSRHKRETIPRVYPSRSPRTIQTYPSCPNCPNCSSLYRIIQAIMCESRYSVILQLRIGEDLLEKFYRQFTLIDFLKVKCFFIILSCSTHGREQTSHRNHRPEMNGSLENSR